MTKKHYCDRCEKEIDFPERDIFDEVNEFFKESSLSLNEQGLNEPELCRKCQKGYNEIVKDTNKQIARYLKEK